MAFQLTLPGKTLQTALLGALLTLVGCSDSSDNPTEKAPETAEMAALANPPAAIEKTAEELAQEKEAALTEKLNAYIACYNAVNNGAQGSYERYADWVDNMKTGPSGNEKRVYGVYTLSEHGVKECESEASAAVDAPPSLPELDQAAKNYIATIKPLADVLQKADKYYSREDYKDDQFAQGKALHPELMAAFDAFFPASDAFTEQLSLTNRKMKEEQLAKIEQAQGKTFNYWVLNTSLRAEDMVGLLVQEEFDVEQANQLIQAYQDSSDELVAYIKSDAKDIPMRAKTTFNMRMENLLVAAKERLRRVRDKTAYNAGDMNLINAGSAWMVRGTPDKVIRVYNEYINESNYL